MFLTTYQYFKNFTYGKSKYNIFYNVLRRYMLDGNCNCMYSSMSLLLAGDDSLVELHCLTSSIELYLNAEYYGKHHVFQSAYLPLKEPKRSPESLFTLKNDTLDSNLINKEDAAKRKAILNCQSFRLEYFQCVHTFIMMKNQDNIKNIKKNFQEISRLSNEIIL